MRWIEYQYRERWIDDEGVEVVEAWSTGRRLPPGVREVVAEETRGQIGRTFDLRARRVDDESGEFSPWAEEQIVVGYSEPAAFPPQGLRVVCGRLLEWSSTPTDGAPSYRYEVRSAPGNWQHFEDMQVATLDHAAPPLDLCTVPRGERTIAVRAVDEEGQVGEPAFLLVNEGPYDDADDVTGRLSVSAPTFANGTITGGTVLLGVLEADSSILAWPETDSAPAWPESDLDTAWPPLYSPIEFLVTYDPGALDGSYTPAADVARLTLGVSLLGGENWRVEWRLHDSPAWSGNDLDPAWPASDLSLAWPTVDDGSPAWGDDADPAWSSPDDDPAWGAHLWRPWPGKIAEFPLARIDVRLLVPGGRVQGKVADFTIRESRPMRRQDLGELAGLDSLGFLIASATRLRSGTLANRPPFGSAGEVYVAQNPLRVFTWDATRLAWTEVALSDDVEVVLRVTVLSTPGSGTFVPLAETVRAGALETELLGGGGGGGGANANAPPAMLAAAGGGGAAGAPLRKRIRPVAASYAYTVGAAGLPGAGGPGAAGGAGGATTFGTGAGLLTAPGGGGGVGSLGVAVDGFTGPGVCGLATGGDVNGAGAPGGGGKVYGGATVAVGGGGGSSALGAGGDEVNNGPGLGALGPGGGGGGGGCLAPAPPSAGGMGGPGLIVIVEKGPRAK